VAAVKSLPVHIVSAVISKIIHYQCHAVMITYIRAIQSTFYGVFRDSSVGCIVGISWPGAVAVIGRVRSQIEAMLLEIYSYSSAMCAVSLP
jgi:hypothetical protein